MPRVTASRAIVKSERNALPAVVLLALPAAWPGDFPEGLFACVSFSAARLDLMKEPVVLRRPGFCRQLRCSSPVVGVGTNSNSQAESVE